MKFRSLSALVIAAAVFIVAPVPATASPAGLKAFRSNDDLKQFLRRVTAARAAANKPQAGVVGEALAPPPPPPPPVSAIATQAKIAAPGEGSITNNQVQGVDEGDIVKASGDLLIVLHHGRLFTLSIAGGGLKPVDAIEASAPGVNAQGDWYDEMLISGARIVVIGYSYSRGGTQVNRFRVTPDGRLSFQDAYALKSNDYYSSRNYASRLIGTKLIFYSPRYIPWNFTGDLEQVFPGLKRFDDKSGAFRPIGTAQNIFISPGQGLESIDAVHTVAACDLVAPVLACTATSVLGPPGRVFYVSKDAVYVWVSAYHWQERKPPTSMLYRLALDGSRPQAVRVHGGPVDQFSFDDAGGSLNVLVRSEADGEAMWHSEHSRGQTALLRVDRDDFGDGTDEVANRGYRALPKPDGDFWSFQNRFVGHHLLYGTGVGWGAPRGGASTLVVVPVDGGEPLKLAVPHSIDRIDIMGHDAVVIGSDANNLVFSAVTLAGTPALGDRYVLAGASQGETRSHGFFFKPEPGPSNAFDGDYGVLGLPVMRTADPAFHQLFRESAAVVFVRRTAGKFGLLGELSSHPAEARADACKASCIDWYGNSRPVFYRGRTFALMGYEIVEGVLGERDMRETGRVNFNPGVPRVVN